MDPSESILNCFVKLSYDIDSHTIVHQYGKGHIELENFVELVRKYDSRIQTKDIEAFYNQMLKETRFNLMTQFVLDKIFKKAGQLKQDQGNHPLRQPDEILQLIGQTVKNRGLDIQRIFTVFDRDQDQSLSEKEFQTFLEYYVPTITGEELKQLKNQYPSSRVTLPELSKLVGLGVVAQSSQIPRQPIIDQPVQSERFSRPQAEVPQMRQQQQDPKPQEQVAQQEKSVALPTGKAMAGVMNKLKAASNFKNILLDHKVPGLADFQKKYQQYVDGGQMFTDNDFPATQKSLGAKTKNYQWKRISEIWGDKHEVFQKDITSGDALKDWINAEDIGQGELGDCYLLSVLSSVALQYPEIISDLFITQKANKSGIYALKLCVDGAWQLIVLDDIIPVIGSKPAFSQSGADESWVVFVEKAWAKLHGSYSNIIGGLSTEVLKSITCGPTWILNSDEPDFKERFEDAFKKECIMTVGTNREGSDYKARGLIPGHAYSILSLHTVRHPQLGEVELVQIRNPWGKTEWNGDWGDKSNLWTEDVKRQLNLVDKDDGEFYMSYKDFISHYHTVFAGYYKKNYMYESLTQVITKKKSAYFTFDIVRDGEYYFTAYQRSERHFRDQYQNYKYSPIRVLLGQADNNGYTYVASACKSQDNVYVGGQLKKGTYVVQVKIPWLYWNEFEFTVSLYGELSVELKKCPKVQEFSEQVMLSKARLNKERQPLSGDQPQILKSQEMKPENGLGYFYFNNQSSKGLELEWTFNKMSGFKLKKPHRGNQIKLSMPAGKEGIVVTSLSPEGFAMSLAQKFKPF